jgi:AraC-like DNA-binding protein
MAPITLDWVPIVALLGAAQGVFLAVILATQQRNRTANRLLAFAMLAFSIGLASIVYYGAGLVQRFPHFFAVSYPLPIVYGPLIYLYAVKASDRAQGFGWRDALHFVPIAAVVLAMMPVLLMTGAEKIAFYHDLQRGMVTPLMRVVDPLKYVSGVSYATITILFLRRHRATVKESYASIERVNLQWVFRLGLASAAIWALATLLEITELLRRPLLARADDAVGLAIAMLVYAIGYKALRQPEIFNYAAIDHRAPEPAPSGPPPSDPVPPSGHPPADASIVAPGTQPVSTPMAPDPTPRYERSGLSDLEAARLERALIAAMEKDRLYQDSELTLADLAERLDTTPHKLSEVLNAQLQQTFYDFVNSYRVKDVQRRIADDRLKNLTILALALDAGFASKSTFNHVFRQHTGRTPSAYRRSLAG